MSRELSGTAAKKRCTETFRSADLHLWIHGGNNMKCFKCGALCVTVYYCGGFYWQPGDKITAVGKACPIHECGWESYPTKLPEKINN